MKIPNTFLLSTLYPVLLTILTGRNSVLLNSVQDRVEIEAWLLLIFFMFTQLIKFYTFHFQRLKSADV